MPARPVRPLVAGVLTAALAAGALAAAPSSAAARDSLPTRLSEAIAAGQSSYTELPRGTVRRREARAVDRLRTAASPAATSGPSARGSLTTQPVSVFNVTYRQDGATWTEAAKAAFEAAVQVWERTLESPVPIEVEATATTFDDPSILGGAGPLDFLRNDKRTTTFTDDVFEPVALSNARRGTDGLPGEPDIIAEFNPALRDSSGSPALYFGLDGNPPAEQVDFRTVVLHELGHGLGMVGTATVPSAGAATIGDRSANGTSGVRSGVSFDTFTYATTEAQAGNGGKRLLSMADGSAELEQALTSGQLYWAGQSGRAAARAVAGGLTCRGQERTEELRLYAPSSFLEGTSYAHVDECDFPGEDANGLMTPFIGNGESIADVGQIAMGMFADMGYAMPALTGSRYTPLAPVRVLDTRSSTGTTGPTRVGPGGVVDLVVAGRSGVPAEARAVVLNVTGVEPSASTDIRVYPTPVVLSPPPTVSSLNLAPGLTRANLVTVPIGNDGKVRLRNTAGSVALLADLAGFYAPTASSAFRAADPVRVLDTRSAVGTARTTRLGAGELLDLDVTGGSSPVPAGATAVVLTVTAVGATASTDVRVYPTPTGPGAPPTVSSINARPGTPVPNVVVVKVGRDGQVRLRNQSGGVHLLADVAGWYEEAGGALFRPVEPARILDTRSRLGTSAAASRTVGAGESVVLQVGGSAQVPSLASAAVLNVTGVGATTSTDVRVYPATATSPPDVSNLNLGRAQTAADLVVVKLGNRSVRLRNAAGEVALLADVSGWFGPAS